VRDLGSISGLRTLEKEMATCSYILGASLVVQMVKKNLPAMLKIETQFQSLVRKFPWRREWLTHSSILA